MKLCRFELLDSPGMVRSGIFHENRLYETAGEKAAGIHDLARVRILTPTGVPPTIRLFSEHGYEFLNTASFMGPSEEYELPGGFFELSVHLHVGAVLRDRGEMVDPDEAPEFVIGYCQVLRFSNGESNDFGVATGPFLVTADDFEDGVLPLELSIGETKAGTVPAARLNFVERALPMASRSNAVQPGDLLILPEGTPSDLPKVKPGDRLLFGNAQLGRMALQIS